MDPQIRLYREKELSAIEGKIYTTKSEGKIFKRNLLKVIGFGVVLSFLGPVYKGRANMTSNHSAASLQEAIGESCHLSSTEAYVASALGLAVLYTLVCFIAHFVWEYQDKKKIESLLQRKKEIEEELDLQDN